MTSRFGILMLALLLLSGCSEDSGKNETSAPDQAPRSTRITVAETQTRPVEVSDSSVGEIRSKGSPLLTAEVGGRLTAVKVDTGDAVEQGDLLARIDPETYGLARQSAAAEVQRLEALVANQRRQVERYRELVKENFVTDSALEEAEAQLRALREQLEAAKSRLQQAELDLRNAEVRAPVDGVIDERRVSAGDYVQRGQPLFRLVSEDLLTIALPFPETVASRLRPGLPVRLTTPLSPGNEVVGEIEEIRPALATGSRSLEVITEIANPGGWRAGASVRGEVILDRRENVVVPEQSVVERPNGMTVYVVEDGVAHARQVELGVRRAGWVEIREGLEPGLTVAVDGASYLSDEAPVTVVEAL